MNELTFRAERRPPISASIICLNEEKNIGRCLDSLGWCDQIVVVDSGSIDRTLDIVRKYQRTRILHRSFDTYINQKNYSLDNCEHEWVLSVDADEVFPPPPPLSGLPFAERPGARIRMENPTKRLVTRARDFRWDVMGQTLTVAELVQDG